MAETVGREEKGERDHRTHAEHQEEAGARLADEALPEHRTQEFQGEPVKIQPGVGRQMRLRSTGDSEPRADGLSPVGRE